MLNENIKNLRKAKGLSQEELAIKLNVVRQTVSKWEKGLSVPDAVLLAKLAEELDVTVAELLGDAAERKEDSELKIIAAKLELINEQFAKKAETTRRMWRIVFTIIGVISSLFLIYALFQIIQYQIFMLEDGDPADSLNIFLLARPVFFSMFGVFVSLVGIVNTRKR